MTRRRNARRGAVPVASRKLLEQLNEIAHSLISAQPGAKDGEYTLPLLWDVQKTQLQELGVLLTRIADGADAGVAFSQVGRDKRATTQDHHFAALQYWAIRAKDPKKPRAEAAAAVRALRPSLHTLKNNYIFKIGQKYQSFAFQAFNNRERLGEGRWEWSPRRGLYWSDKFRIEFPTPAQVAALHEYLQRKSARTPRG